MYIINQTFDKPLLYKVQKLYSNLPSDVIID